MQSVCRCRLRTSASALRRGLLQSPLPAARLAAHGTRRATPLQEQQSLSFSSQSARLGLSQFSGAPPAASQPRLPNIRALFVDGKPGDHAVVQGWVRSVRSQKAVCFVEVSDGSTLKNCQVILDSQQQDPQITTGASLKVTGVLQRSPGKGQAIELVASDVVILGTSDPEHYPLQKKRHSPEFLRDIAHLRPRTNTHGAVLRMRNTLGMAIHRHFQDQDYIHVNTPIITSSDCEGAGELFRLETGAPVPQTPECKAQPRFFGAEAYLTVSGQLHAEALAAATSRVYVLGPTFRAENSHTKRHLAEFYMLEAEVSFIDQMDELTSIVSACVKDVLATVLAKNADDIALFQQYVDSSVLERLQTAVEKPFVVLTYTEAIEVLEAKRTLFKVDPKWGMDLNTEHERFLCEQYCKSPVFVINYPAAIKPFYMRRNVDGRTVAALDLLVPGIGELVGGSLREERYDVLKSILREKNLLSTYEWYLDLRKYGTVPHGGFGLGFERLVQYTTGLENIRDAIPFPRAAGLCRF